MSNNSQDEVISLVEFKSPTKIPRRTNRVSSPKTQSSASTKNDRGDDIVTLFSIKSKNPPKEDDDISVATTEMSDDVFVDKKKTYRDKIRERFKVIKTRTGSSAFKAASHKGSKEKLLLDRIRKESRSVDADVQSIRNKFKLPNCGAKNLEFFCDVKSVEPDERTEDEVSRDDLLIYILPEQLQNELEAFKLENCFMPTSSPIESYKKLEDEPRFLEEEGFYVNRHDLCKRNLNIIEQRLLSIDDKKWFNCEGELTIQPSPLQPISQRPIDLIEDPGISHYLPPSTIAECTEVIISQPAILQLHINEIQFHHHPLFSVEHVLERKLKNLYDHYQEFTENSKLSRIIKKLEAIRHVKRNMEKLQPDDIRKYKKDIEELKKLSYEQGKLERDNIKSILETWRCIKKIREINGYSNTKIKLMIQKQATDARKEREDLEKQITYTVQEIKEDYKLEFKEKQKQYKKQLGIWEMNIREDGNSTSEEAPEKPTYEIDEGNIRKQVQEQHDLSFKPPGEPILSFFLLDTNDITKDINSSKEKIRRNAVLSTKISLRILCNNVEVCKTAPVPLNDDFNCLFDESLSIQLTNVPRSITIEVIEQPKALLKRKIIGIELDLPEQDLKGTKKLLLQMFDKNEIIHYKHEGVGSGYKMSKILEDYGLHLKEDYDLVTTGKLTYRMHWTGYQENKKETLNGFDADLLNKVIDKNGTINIDKLTDWLSSNSPDPQDPKNSILYEYISGFDGDLSLNRKCKPFRLSPHTDSLNFCNVKELDDNLRFTILQLRNQNEIEFDGLLVPNRTKEIPFYILNDYKKRLAVENKVVLEEEDFDGELEVQRSNSKKYLRQIHCRIYQKCKNYENNLFRFCRSHSVDYLNPESLNGLIAVNLYGTTVKNDEGMCKWLGFVDIPLAAVVCNNNLRGKFKVIRPYHLNEFIGELEKQKGKSPRLNPMPQPSDTFIEMDINIEPPVPKLTPSMVDLPSNDAPFIHDHIIRWNEIYNNNFPNRRFHALAIDVHCRTNCLTKWIRPLEPPQINSETFEFGVEQCVRYVSLIPFTESNQFYHNVWLTTEQLLNLSIGSIIDHAVTLTCYLLALKVEVWLLLGFGIPHGFTAYVFMKEVQRDGELPTYYLYDVSEAKRYSPLDEDCPLQRIYCIVNETNIWGNTQRTDNIAFTRFDLSRRSDWLPLFNNTIQAPVNSINLRVEYKPCTNMEYLEIQLERKIKKRISKLRKLTRTIWRHNVTHTFKSFFKSLETSEMFERLNYDVVSQMYQTVSSQKMNGYIINTPFFNVASVVKKVEDTLIYIQEERDNEFGLSVYVQSYPGQILAVWICVVCFTSD